MKVLSWDVGIINLAYCLIDYQDDKWIQIGSNIDGDTDGDFLGRSLSLSNDGKEIAIGAPIADSNSLTNNGYLKIFELDSIAPTIQEVTFTSNDGFFKGGDNIKISIELLMGLITFLPLHTYCEEKKL